MINIKRISVIVFVLLMFGLAYSAFAQTPAPENLPEVPFLESWASSGHADAKAEAFTHWDEEDPPEVPVTCAKCHGTPGYLDFLGADGSTALVVDKAAPAGSVITCVACHNPAAITMNSVVMPSGLEISGLGAEARCIQCHQGRAASNTVDESIAKAGLSDPDTTSTDLGFTNIHYFAAAATMYGTQAMGGYQYPGKSYDAKFEHVREYDTCIECHSPHNLALRLDSCSQCHTEVVSKENVKDIRSQGSLVDYDGDGDMAEGVYYEIQGLQDVLYRAMQAYTQEISGTAVVYSPTIYPYFFLDLNENGTIDDEEAQRENMFTGWTPRLAKAAYNYQTSIKDPGGFAHGGKYIIQLLYDSIADLSQALTQPIDLANARRIDHGHFAGSEEAFRHWDADGVVPAACSKCHTGVGLPLFIKEGVTISQPPDNGLLCSTCHDSLETYTVYPVKSVRFPSGAALDGGDASTNLCMNCHQGRQSTVSVNAAVSGKDDDTVSDGLSFLNVHYFAAGATRFGTEAKGAYEYDGQTYNGPFAHVPGFDTCTGCHVAHTLEIKIAECGSCHPKVDSTEKLTIINMSNLDFDGDGDPDEGIAGEIETLHEMLYSAIQEYAANVAGTATVYDAHTHPYFFTDTNGDGETNADEVRSDNAYATWTPRLLKAAYNYQYVAKDPGAFAHNGKYIVQILQDSITDLGKKLTLDTTRMRRPEIPVPPETPEPSAQADT